MRGGARAESWGEKCRRADIPELEHGWRGGGTSGNGEICEREMDAGSKIVGAPTILILESARPAQVRQAAFDRPEGRPLQGPARLCQSKNVGAPTILNRKGWTWSAGACSRFYGVNTGTQMIVWEVGRASQKRRRAAALQNCRRADNSKNWKFVTGVVG